MKTENQSTIVLWGHLGPSLFLNSVCSPFVLDLKGISICILLLTWESYRIGFDSDIAGHGEPGPWSGIFQSFPVTTGDSFLPR